MSEPLFNKVKRYVIYITPVGVVIYFTKKLLKPTDNFGKTTWNRLYSMYGIKGYDGAEILIRNQPEAINEE